MKGLGDLNNLDRNIELRNKSIFNTPDKYLTHTYNRALSQKIIEEEYGQFETRK